MAKRRNRTSTPNIPAETLARARRQAAGLDPDVPDEIIEQEAPIVAAAEAVAAAPVSTAGASRRRIRERKQLAYEEMTSEEIAERLSNPTRTVDPEELHAQYGYVLADLRSMGLLSAILFIALILIAGFIVV